MEQHLEALRKAVENCDADAAREAARRALEAGVDPIAAIERGAAEGIRKVGEKFEKGEAFLPHLVMAGDAMTEAIRVLEKAIPQGSAKSASRGTIVLGTVKGDIHDIGKNIVGAMLVAAGFKLNDIGKDAPAELFIGKAQETHADIIAASALMTITRPAQRELVEELRRLDLRGSFKLLVGGGTVTPEWAREIGADGYGKNAIEAGKVARGLLESVPGR